MAITEDLAQFPRGQVSVDGGPLYNITDFDSTYANGAKLVATLRRKIAGVMPGKATLEFSFTVYIDELGDERDWDAWLEDTSIHAIRCKVPGGVTREARIVLTSVGLAFQIEDGCKRAIKAIGKWVA
jgi:hypothetical protein